MSAGITQRITPFLWFDNQAEEAMNFYVSIFKNSKTGTVTRYGETGPGAKGSVMTSSFTLDEPQASLGTALKLPPWYEEKRAEIEKTLPPLE